MLFFVEKLILLDPWNPPPENNSISTFLVSSLKCLFVIQSSSLQEHRVITQVQSQASLFAGNYREPHLILILFDCPQRGWFWSQLPPCKDLLLGGIRRHFWTPWNFFCSKKGRTGLVWACLSQPWPSDVRRRATGGLV